jgi:hypothetical protein
MAARLDLKNDEKFTGYGHAAAIGCADSAWMSCAPIRFPFKGVQFYTDGLFRLAHPAAPLKDSR